MYFFTANYRYRVVFFFPSRNQNILRIRDLAEEISPKYEVQDIHDALQYLQKTAHLVHESNIHPHLSINTLVHCHYH